MKVMKGFIHKKYQNHILCSFAYKCVYIDDRFTGPIVVFRGEMLLINLLRQFLTSMNTVKK